MLWEQSEPGGVRESTGRGRRRRTSAPCASMHS
jgi:hypothetical protein